MYELNGQEPKSSCITKMKTDDNVYYMDEKY
jgi:hypothetical protein